MIRTYAERLFEGRTRFLVLSGMLVAMLVAASLMLARPARADTFTVNNTNDAGAGSLRQAILDANASKEKDVIGFNIPGGGVKTIAPAGSTLPDITAPVLIDGYSQPGSRPNSRATGGLDAVILIELSGINGIGNGFEIAAPNVVVRGLAINRFRFNGIQTNDGAQGARIEGNFIGTDASGTLDRGNLADGVNIRDGNGHAVGGLTPEARNLISGNNSRAINLEGNGGNKVQGNLIGVQKDGITFMGGTREGVDVDTPNNTIGGTTPEAANVIAHNSVGGVLVGGSGSTGNRILGNSIFSNGALGIDLGEDGRTQNDPRDRDTGENTLQNFPILTSAEKFSADRTVISGTLDSTPSTRSKKRTFTVQFFVSDTDVDAIADEGQIFLGQKRVATNRKGKVSFTFESTRALFSGDRITATATGPGGNTSEFSDPVVVDLAPGQG